MRSQAERWIDLGGLALSVTIPIVLWMAWNDFTNPSLNYREMSIDGAVKSMLFIGFAFSLMIVQVIALLHL